MEPELLYREKLEAARNPRTPRPKALVLLRQLYLEDLLETTLLPAVSGGLRRVAEDAVINRLPALAVGERINLARRATGRVAGALILDRDVRVVETALGNSHLTEELVVKALSYESVTIEAVERIADHPRWSVSYGVKLSLLRQPLTSLARVLRIAPLVARKDLLEVAGDPRMPVERRAYLERLTTVGAKQGRANPPFAV